MIESKSDLNDWLHYEGLKYGFQDNIKGRILLYVKYLLGSERATIWKWQKRLRITEYHQNKKHKIRYLFSKIYLNRMSNKYSLHIGLNVFDRGLHIMHLGPILTNGRVRVGKDCSIHINTALVAKGTSSETPILGDNCIIGVGGVIIGGVKLEDGIAIGAGAVVCSSYDEPNIAIAGVPARKVSNHGKVSWNRQ